MASPLVREWQETLDSVRDPIAEVVVQVNPLVTADPPLQEAEQIALLQPNHASVAPDVVSTISEHFGSALDAAHIRFGVSHADVVRAFLASLLTKRLVILSGLSGAGKTQIALRLGQWFGDGYHLLVPVRPDWTGPEALLGFEDALTPALDGKRQWAVPAVLEFILRAARDPMRPYMLVLDEMNLAHVERYFADVLAGIESGTGCVPNLLRADNGNWYIVPTGEFTIPFPSNLFVAGTVNVDETTYMFSPKVLDRANTIEFRVSTADLADDPRPLGQVPQAPEDLLAAFVDVAGNSNWHRAHPAADQIEFASQLRRVHAILTEHGYEFGHRVFFEANRFAALLAASGSPGWSTALDYVVLQKLLPRLHGARRRLEPVLVSLARFAYDLSHVAVPPGETPFDPLGSLQAEPELPLSFQKLVRMTRSVRANQFASFME
jgi:5-methylcytosine-specific restriction protein B